MSGGVRNLRAMFENKDVSSSPPADRGRSPAGSFGPGSNGTSPRPLSKVRTSFVAVERSGQLGSQLGLKREESGEPSLSRRRTSFSIDEEDHPKTTAERKQSIATEFEARKLSTMIGETIPEVAVETPSIESNKQLGEDIKLPKSLGPVDIKKAAMSNATLNGHTNGKPVTTEKIVEKPSSNKFSARPAPISTTKPSSTSSKPSPRTLKSPAAPTAPKTPTTPRGRPKDPVKQVEKVETKIEKKDGKSVALHTTKAPTKPPSAATSVSSKTRIPPSPPQTGFVKPKPRSPTRPIKLPASLTAHTASSGSKTSAVGPPPASSRQSLSRASGNSLSTNVPTLARSPSRPSTASAAKSLVRKPSTLNKVHSRPSLGPPPAQAKRQISRPSLPQAPADEGFLHRMMRPTTSSASKTAEKTPPKRAHSLIRPVTRDGFHKSEASKAAAPKMGKLFAKPIERRSKSAELAEEEKGSISSPAEELKPQVADNSAAVQVQEIEAHESITEVEKVNGDTLAATEIPNSTHIPVLENVPEVESTPEKPVPIEELLVVPESTDEEQVSGSTGKATISESEERAAEIATLDPATPEMNIEEQENIEDDAHAVPDSESEGDSDPTKLVEVEVSKVIELSEAPEDLRAREEIARLNAEVMKISADEDVE